MTTKQQIQELIEAEPNRYRQIDLVERFGVTKQRVNQIVTKLSLKDKLAPKRKCFCIQCGNPTSRSNRCWECYKKWCLTRWIEFLCDNCGNLHRQPLNQFNKSKLHFCSRQCLGSYVGKHYGYRVHDKQYRKEVK